jgi:hypothetical protein
MLNQALQSPIMVIGAGRSGSTLLSRVLNTHSALDFKGETSFLLLRVWMEAWNDRFWLNWPRHVATGPHCAADPLPPMPPEALDAERARVGRLVAELLVAMLQVDLAHHRAWGYKELWSGLPQYDHDWRAYDAVLPGAYWLHLIRHPFDFARSSADWNGTLLTRAYLEARLVDWVAMLACNRRRSETGRYREVRLQDLVTDAQASLTPVLEAAGLAWEPAMGQVVASKTMTSRHAGNDDDNALTREQAEALIDGIPGLAEAMASCGYAPPARTVLADTARPEALVEMRDPEGENPDRYLPRFSLEARLHQAEAKLQQVRSALEHLRGEIHCADLDGRFRIQARNAQLQQVRSLVTQLSDDMQE